ncbi:septal ring lytic transglycosylase RlpA family protein [Ferruginibacter paludis]|uniref:septal ring lytic transglycosylase RlpA family protein n=1 Tax=Ferruginibacter paludis TaxID=1310417 RepID=UPI0025B4C5B6|nr:septal ring lytic transglycosylase RlpA family protein [Ferruginibacter paludis]MDN3654990.1 septal ring lytic transglycosylase RlpA family protein [Ferruginibacter paludis]
MKNFYPTVRSVIIMFFCLHQYTGTSAQSTAKESNPVHASRRILYGTASFYANKFNGRQTASGEIFSQDKLTCACNVLPFGTWIKVTNIKNGNSAIVKVNDRMHPKMKRIVDLTRATAISLGYKSQGIVKVKVEVLGKTRPQL